MTQEEIAAAENYSGQTISKALHKAKDRGIIRISVIPEKRTGYLNSIINVKRVGGMRQRCH